MLFGLVDANGVAQRAPEAVETDLLERATVFCPRPACFRVIQRLFSWRAGVLGMHVFSG